MTHHTAELEHPPAPVFVRRRFEKSVYGISPSTIDRLIAQGLFPRRQRVGAGCVGTLYAEGKAALERLAQEG